ncbi:MAG: CNNM domain-containing protein [Pirellulales bacterium]
MELILNDWPWLLAMFCLIGCSALFSASEAAFFYLKSEDRKKLASGTSTQKVAAGLLGMPERLLSAVLFWNLVINVLYFSLASIIGIRLKQEYGGAASTLFAAGSLLVIIFFSEMLPKSLAVLRAPSVATFFSIPVALAIQVVSPLMPLLTLVNELSRRIIWPKLEPENYLQISDLERAIAISNDTEALNQEEEQALHGIVSLSDVSVDELMRPRLQYQTFRSPVALVDLQGALPASGYILISDSKNEDVISAVNLKNAYDIPDKGLEGLAKSVVCVPWCMPAAVALQKMWLKEREVATVVNELGETIGILTMADLTDTIFSQTPGRSERLLQRSTFEEIDKDKWLLTGMTNLRRLAKRFEVELPETRHATVNGVLQECLEQLPEVEDEVDWGPFHFVVVEANPRGQTMLHLTLNDEGEE